MFEKIELKYTKNPVVWGGGWGVGRRVCCTSALVQCSSEGMAPVVRGLVSGSVSATIS
jgi:hypothetical protein